MRQSEYAAESLKALMRYWWSIGLGAWFKYSRPAYVFWFFCEDFYSKNSIDFWIYSKKFKSNQSIVAKGQQLKIFAKAIGIYWRQGWNVGDKSSKIGNQPHILRKVLSRSSFLSGGTRWGCILDRDQDHMRLHSTNRLGLDKGAFQEMKRTK